MTNLFVASTGGHLAELHALAPRLPAGPRLWVTFDSPQSRCLLDGEEVVHVPPATSRDIVGATRDYLAARRLFRSRRFDAVISTGASVALSVFAPAAAAGARCHYIESATRTRGPSLTGRLVARMPGTRLFTQQQAWTDDRWRYGGSVFDAFTAVEGFPAAGGRTAVGEVTAAGVARGRTVSKVVVTLGTHPRYRFPRLLGRLAAILPPELEVLWQVGSTRIKAMPPGARAHVPMREMAQAMREADVVISHAGVGSALAAMQAGRRAIYVPRRRSHGEHVDDHQVDLARLLDERNLVVAREADEVTVADLEEAAAWRVGIAPDVPPFLLGDHPSSPVVPAQRGAPRQDVNSVVRTPRPDGR